jgi:hypothetical protein
MFILLVHQMIGVVGFKNLVMNQRMAFERITKFAQGPMHDIAVQNPFKNGSKHQCQACPDRTPEKESKHLRNLSC